MLKPIIFSSSTSLQMKGGGADLSGSEGRACRQEALTTYRFAAQHLNFNYRLSMFAGQTFLWQAQPLFLPQSEIHSPLYPKGRAKKMKRV